MEQAERREPPVPDPAIVRAAREHLTGQRSHGVERLMWESHKHPMADLKAIEAVIKAGSRGDEIDGTELAAALVLVQAVRLDLDRLESRLLDTARDSGLTWESIAAVLDLPGAAAAIERHRWLSSRHAEPVAGVDAPELSTAGNAWHGAMQAGERAREAADRAAELAHHRAGLRGGTAAAPPRGVSSGGRPDGVPDRAAPDRATPGRGTCGRGTPEQAQNAAARADDARMRSEQARDRAILSFLRTADRHERAAEAMEARATGKDVTAIQRQAAEYRSAAATYRRLAERMRGSADGAG